MTTIKDITNKFRTAIVGGFVRDTYIGVPSKDKDFVVESNVEEFELAFPLLKKVGNSFPVYIVEGCEIALTRSEVSTGTGYTDFECNIGVTIEEDMARRDFTINSFFIETPSGEVIDPFNGIEDIENKIIRCINPTAFHDDPLRIIRGIRFATRFGFTIEPDTIELMKQSAHNLKHILPERIELELRKTYEQSDKPSQFFRLLDAVGGLIPHFEEIWKAKFVPAGPIQYHPEISCFNHFLQSFDKAKENGYEYHIGIAALVHDFGKLETPEEEHPSHIGHDLRKEVIERFFARHRFSSDVQELSFVTLRSHMRIHDICKIKRPIKLIRFIRGIRKHHREDFFKAANCDSTITEEQWNIIRKTELAINSTKIEITPELAKKGKEAITNFVETEILKTFKGL